MSAYSDKVIADGASNYWRLNEPSGTSAVDVVGAKNGTISGGVTLAQPGALVDGDTAMTFNGTTGKIVTAAAVTLPVISSVEAWFKTTSSAFQYYVELPGVSIGSGPNSGNKPFLYDGSVKNGNKVISDGLWHHVVWTFSGATATVYVDGVLDASGAQVFAAPVSGVASISAASGFWNGSLDDIAIYPRALTPAEISAHYTLGTTAAGGSRNQLSFGYWKKVWSAA